MSGTQLSTKYIDAIQLSERERQALMRTMEKSGSCDRRKHPRVMVEGKFSILVQLEYPGGSSANFRVQPWDLSRGGLGFFHRAYVHPGTRCTFTGNMTDGQPISIKGEVVRCAHVAGMVHTVGCKFEMEIDPEVFLGEAATGFAAPAAPQPAAPAHAAPDAEGSATPAGSVEAQWSAIESACTELNAAVNSKQGLEVIAERARHVADLALCAPAAEGTPPDAAPPPPPTAAPETPAEPHADAPVATDAPAHAPDAPKA